MVDGSTATKSFLGSGTETKACVRQLSVSILQQLTHLSQKNLGLASKPSTMYKNYKLRRLPFNCCTTISKKS
eukprot:GSA25T00014714001.1